MICHYLYNFVCNIVIMAIISNKSQILFYTFSTYFIFTLIISTIVLYFGNGNQVSFSQGYIPPPSNNPKPQSFICGQTAFNGPSYRGPDGCPAQCPTTNSDNIPKGCPTPSNNPKPQSFICGQTAFNGPSYRGPDGCPAQCPTTNSDNIPKGCPTPSSGSTSTTQNEQPNQVQQQPANNCNTNLMIGCGSINPNNSTTPNQSPQTNTPDTTNTGGSTSSNSFGPNQPFSTQNPNTNLGKGSTSQLANPTAFNYQINPEKRFVDISKDPTQKINSIVTNSFGQGVPDIPVSIQVKDPSGNTAALFTGKTDNDGKNVVSFPVKTAGTWTALVVISSNATVGGPFSDQITWNAVSRSIPNLVCSTGPHPNCHVE